MQRKGHLRYTYTLNKNDVYNQEYLQQKKK